MRADPNDQLFFRVSPRVLAPLGMEQLHDPALAVLELVKNAWDAAATRVRIEINQRESAPEIVVSDNGIGMSRQDFRDHWLVIGASHKRGVMRSGKARPLIGEKGLGRLASYALGETIKIESVSKDQAGFEAVVDWGRLLESASVEDYKVSVRPTALSAGTRITIGKLKKGWTEANTEFLTTHAQFLTSVPGEKFAISLSIDGRQRKIRDPLDTISKIAEGEMDVEVGVDGVPQVVRCVVDSVDLTGLQYRDFGSSKADKRLVGSKLRLKFYRRDQAVKKLSSVLSANEINEVLERYQGVRIYRDGINVPPYGLNGDDWAALEKQRTSTGGPTMVPGNSQLIGELRVPASAKHLVITAGRSGFSDQSAVKVLASYVQWAVKQLGTARRARTLGILPGGRAVPTRVDSDPKGTGEDAGASAREVLKSVADQQSVKSDPQLRSKVNAAREVLERELDRTEETLRLYAQLASTGIAATSFAHELRADFDVVTEAVLQLADDEDTDEELIDLLSSSWQRITSFVALFRVLPVKVRRQRRTLTLSSLRTSVEAVSKLAPADKVKVSLSILDRRLSVVPAELDSVLLNLVSNAVKAIAESSRSNHGKLKISLLNDGSDLLVSVADNGCGVSKKVASVMFEPLEGKFSEGTGMGLPIVKFIAERYDGCVELNRQPPAGYATDVRVRLKGVVK